MLKFEQFIGYERLDFPAYAPQTFTYEYDLLGRRTAAESL